jgi:AraC-like DNA-binding protein
VTYNRNEIILHVDEILSLNPRTCLSDLASKLQIERHTIEKVVYETSRLSFKSYRDKQILEKSLRLITRGGCLTIKQIAARIGFASTASFSRFVKNHTRRTPTSIREDCAVLHAQAQNTP